MDIYICDGLNILQKLASGSDKEDFFRCPKKLEWRIRAQLCEHTESYTCLYDPNYQVYRELCKGPREEQQGSKASINNNNFNNLPCSENRFQPVRYSTVQNCDCMYEKSSCEDEGSVKVFEGSGEEDVKCRCDYTRGYTYLTKPKDHCNCEPMTEDCSCVKATCSLGEKLSQDYNCISEKNENNMNRSSLCEVLNSSSHVIEVKKDVFKIKSLDADEYTDRRLVVLTVLICFIIFLIFCGIGLMFKEQIL